MIKIFLFAIAAIVFFIVVLLLYLLIEDMCYPPYDYRHSSNNKGYALLLTLKLPEMKTLKSVLSGSHLDELLKASYQEGAINIFLPYAHQSISHPDYSGQWNATILLYFDSQDEAVNIGKALRQTIVLDKYIFAVKSLDLLVLQSGLDMFYPLKHGLNREKFLIQTLEFVFSDPAHREQYYLDQYAWSGPAMADLHSRDKAGRFIGFETTQRLYGKPDMPQWDVFHVYGFTPWQMVKAFPFFVSTWNKHAKRAFGDGCTFDTKLKEWDHVRINIKTKAQQNEYHSLSRQ